MQINAGSSNSRLVQTPITVASWRQYKASVWIQTSASFVDGGSVNVRIYDMTGGTIVRQLNQNILSPPAGSAWTQYNWTFNTMNTTVIGIYLGTWGGPAAGTVW
jgi:hypothetical protein